MGRYYRTSSATPLDYMYKANAPLMEKVVEANDQFIDQNLAGLSQLGQLANYNHLLGDDEDAQKIIGGYRTKVDDLAKSIQKDPANWRKHLDPIRDLSRSLQTDYESGPISKQIYNYTQRKTAFDNLDKQVELYHTSGGTKGVNPADAVKYKQHWDSKFDKTGFNPSTGTYNVYKGGAAMDDINVEKVLAEGIDKMKASGSEIKQDEKNGMYLEKTTRGWEAVSPERILAAMRGNLTPQVLQFLKERTEIGAISGVYKTNPDGTSDLIEPYEYKPIGMTPEESQRMKASKLAIDATKDPAKRKQLQESFDAQNEALLNRKKLEWNNGSYLGRTMQGIIAKNAWSKEKVYNELRPDGVSTTIFNANQAWGRQTRQLEQSKAIADQNDKRTRELNADNLKERARQFDERQKNPTGTKAAANKNKDKLVVAPPETTVSKLGTRSFESMVTTDRETNKDVPAYSLAGVSSDLDRKKTELDNINTQINFLNKQIKDHPENAEAFKIERSKLEKDRLITQSEVDQKRKLFTTATDAALASHPSARGEDIPLKPDEIALYKKFEDDKDGAKFQKHIQELQAKYPDMLDPNEGGHSRAIGGGRMIESPQVKEAKDTWEKYRKISSRVNKFKDNFIRKIGSDVITDNAIQPNETESLEAGKILFANPTGFQLFENYNNAKVNGVTSNTGSKWFGDSYNGPGSGSELSLANGDLQKYIERNNVKVKVLQIGNSTKLGNGNAVVKVQFDDPNGKLTTDPYYVTVNREVQRDLATKFKGSKNPEVAQVAKDLDDDELIDIRTQFTQPSINRTLGVGNKFEPGSFTVLLNDGKGGKAPVLVTPFTEGGTDHFQVRLLDKAGNLIKDEKGNYKHLPRQRDEKGNPIGGTDGFFNGFNDFSTNWKNLSGKK